MHISTLEINSSFPDLAKWWCNQPELNWKIETKCVLLFKVLHTFWKGTCWILWVNQKVTAGSWWLRLRQSTAYHALVALWCLFTHMLRSWVALVITVCCYLLLSVLYTHTVGKVGRHHSGSPGATSLLRLGHRTPHCTGLHPDGSQGRLHNPSVKELFSS